MKIETLKRNKLKKYAGIVLVFIAVIVTVLQLTSRAKYRTTQSIKLAEGTITNYSTADVNVAVYWGDKAKSAFPDKNSGYQFDKVVCSVESIANKATWSNEAWSLNMEVTEPVKCWIYFTYTPEMSLSLSGDYTNKTVTVTNDFKSSNLYKVTKYYYSLDGKDYVESTNSSYTFTEWQGVKLSASKYTIYTKAVDEEGNETSVITGSIWLDNAAPNLMFSAGSTTSGNNGWYKSYTMNIKATDENNIGTFQYCVTTSTTCTPNININAGTTEASYNYTFGTASSAQRVCATSTDVVGNNTGVKCSEAYKVDVTKPTISNMSASVNNKTINISVNATDVGSGGLTYFYSIDGGRNYTSRTSNTYSVTVGAGTYSIYTYVVDSAGNQSAVKTTSVEIKNIGKDAIIANAPTITTRTDFSTTVENTNTGTLYTAEDDYGTSYYYAGNPTDNWVKFGGFYWRIIRINGDGTIRMIYQGTAANTTGTGTQISTSAFNSDMYVEYQYTSGQVHGNGTNSTIKGVVDTWYNSNLSGYASKIATGGGATFCNDRTPYSESDTGTDAIDYAAYNRLASNKAPSLKCTDSGDRFGTAIGLITADEIAYAGGVYNKDNTGYYLYTNQYYWTMSPSYYAYDYAYVFSVSSSGWLTGNGVNLTYGVRPVISLKADTQFSSGNGTSSNPYTVSD